MSDEYELFSRASELAEAEQLAFVLGACAGNEQLAGDVLELLRCHHSLRSYDSSGGSRLPDAIGSYRVLRELGRGGMGVVYLCHQANLRRLIAVKLLDRHAARGADHARFQREAEHLARFTHEHIARVIEFGKADVQGTRRPFIALEFVDGMTLTEYARRSGVGLQRKLDVFIKVCRGVQHAHQKGVLHRDLKPGNILVTEDGTPKVLDFGIARALDGEESGAITRAGQLVGTLQYMSPEQLEGASTALDTRSDVYSLGVIGYELLAGRLPYEVSDVSLHDAMTAIRDARPASIVAIDREFGRDLDAILRHALEKEPARRYDSAAELAGELERMLRYEPVQARPPSRTYLLRCLVRRNQIAAATMAVAVLASIGVVTVYVSKSREVWAAERRALSEGSRAKTTLRFFEDAFGSLHPSAARGRQTLAGDLLATAEKRLDGAVRDDPALAAYMHGFLGALYRDLGDLDVASAHLERAHGLYRSLAVPAKLELVKVCNALGVIRAKRGEFGEAHASFTEGLALEAESDVRDPRLRSELELSAANLAFQQADLERAEREIRAILTEREKLFGSDDADTLVACGSLGNVIAEAGRPEEAEPLLQRAFDGLQRSLGADHPYVIHARSGLIALAFDRRDVERGTQLARDGIEIARRVLGDDHLEFLEELNTYALFLDDAGRSDEALEAVAEVVERGSLQLPNDHLQLLRWRFNQALLLQHAGQVARAEPIAVDVLERFRRVRGREHPQVLDAVITCVQCWSALGMWQPVLDETGAVLNDTNDDHVRRKLLMARCNALERVGRIPEAVALARELLVMLDRMPELDGSIRQQSVERLARVFDVAELAEEAADARRRLR
ncbi:MAG: protein kinase domain-containing protein [Planctomycetota bacterium]